MTNLCDDCIHAMVWFRETKTCPPIEKICLCHKTGQVMHPPLIESCKYRQTENPRRILKGGFHEPEGTAEVVRVV